MHFSFTSITSLIALISYVNAHGAIIAATGDQGGKGSAIGIVPTTPRDGSRRNPFQTDTTIFNRQANAPGCGRTIAGGKNNIQTGTQAVLAQNGGTLPQVTPGGALSLTVQQVNGDGAGPYACSVNADGTGVGWTRIQVTQNVPGKNGNSRARATAFPLTAQLPADMACTGTVAGQNNVCLVKCQNPVGPFGGCVPVQAATANATAPVAAAPAVVAPVAAAKSSAPVAAAAAAAADADAAAKIKRSAKMFFV